MTNEKLEEKNTQTAVRKETQAVTKRPVQPVRGKPPCKQKKGVEYAVSAGIGFGLGFLFGGTKFPLNTYPLGCALI